MSSEGLTGTTIDLEPSWCSIPVYGALVKPLILGCKHRRIPPLLSCNSLLSHTTAFPDSTTSRSSFRSFRLSEDHCLRDSHRLLLKLDRVLNRPEVLDQVRISVLLLKLI